MRVLYFSDIHLEIRKSEPSSEWVNLHPLGLGPDLRPHRGTADLAILAGDIGKIREGGSASARDYAQQVSEYLDCPVIYIPGNHEYYGGRFPGDRDMLKRESHPDATVLDRGMALFPHRDGQLRILGATFWTDYAALGDAQQAMASARRSLNDHRRISRDDGGQFEPEDALAEHFKSREWLFDRLEERHVGPTIIVTHHVPHPVARNPAFAPDYPLGPAFFSDCSRLVEAAGLQGVSAWIFGHHHHCVDTTIFGVRLLSAQLGYPGEETGWAGPGILDI